jgi:RecT family
MENESKPMELLKQSLPELKALLALNSNKDVDVDTIAFQELEYMRHYAVSNPKILECLPSTIVMAVKFVLKQNLTLDPYAGLIYVKTRGVKVGDSWKTALEILPSANGLVSIARQCGRILDIKRPEVTKDEKGKVISVSLEVLIPSTPSPRWEKMTFDEDDFYRWQRASHKENGRNKQDASSETFNYANENYTNWKGGIDPEFARAKAIRHGLKKLGTNPNERNVHRIVIDAPKTIVVDSSADMAASNDEVQYTSHETVSSEIKTEKESINSLNL